jgi:hypothetical protein
MGNYRTKNTVYKREKKGREQLYRSHNKTYSHKYETIVRHKPWKKQPNFENSTKYGKVGRIDKLIAGRGMVASSRSVGSNCRARKFWVQDVYTEHELP